MAEVGSVAAVDQEHIGRADPGHPAFRADGGQRGEFEQAERLPAQAAHVVPAARRR